MARPKAKKAAGKQRKPNYHSKFTVFDPRKVSEEQWQDSETKGKITDALNWFSGKDSNMRLQVILRAYMWRHMTGDPK